MQTTISTTTTTTAALPPSTVRAERPRALWAAFALALAGCTASVDRVAPSPTPPADGLSIRAAAFAEAAPLLTFADDEDPSIAGVQLTVRVDVDDGASAVQDVTLALDGDDGHALHDVVSEGLDGHRAAFFVVTLHEGDNPLVARAPLPGGAAPLFAQAVLGVAPTR